jgi:hypothetical protein
MGELARLRGAIESQGYRGLSDSRLLELDPWLRVAPAFSAGWTVVATALASPRGLLLLAALTAAGALMPRHPFDLPYHLVLRHWVGGSPMPPTPAPRRVASIVACSWLVLTALAFAAERHALGTSLGSVFTLVALLPVVSGVCGVAWIWTRLARRGASPASFEELSS